MTYVSFGKQVLSGRKHVADARDEEMAVLIAKALNRVYPKPKSGGKRMGGLARAASMTAEQRSEAARKAARARWHQ